MTYNLSVWRDAPPDLLSFGRDFSEVLWTHGTAELKALGWNAFAAVGQLQLSDSGGLCYMVAPQQLLDWLLELERMAQQFPEAMPDYAQIWKMGQEHWWSDQVYFQVKEQVYLARTEAGVFEILAVESETVNLDLSVFYRQLQHREGLNSVLELTLAQFSEALAGSGYRLEYAPILDYFAKELAQLKVFAQRAQREGDKLWHECS